nr:hypothetical protein [uncultured Fluviicola sp.]
MLPNIRIAPKEQVELLKTLDTAFSNQELDFSEQLCGLYKTQTDLVKKYGRDGLMLLIDCETRVYVDSETKRSLEIMHYHAIPKDCPWHELRELQISDFIQKVWAAFPISFVEVLKEYTKDLFVIFEDKKWYMVYAYQGKDYNNNSYYDFLGGCQPEQNAGLPKALLDTGWKMPKDLQELYSVHSIFGDLKSVLKNAITDCIPNASSLETSLTFLEEYVVAWEVDYTFFDLLPFCEDGAGNSQNFYKAEPTENSYATVDWDHETKEISGASTLAEFMEHQFAERMV